MQRPRRLIGWALASLVGCLLCACDGGGNDPRRTSERSEHEPGGEGSAASVELTWGPVERIAGKGGNRAATPRPPDGTATVMWPGSHNAVSREARPGMPWKPGEAMPHTRGTGNLIAG